MHTRWNQATQQHEPSVVYEIATGRALNVYPVDARELVASGEYSYEPQPMSEASPSASVDPGTTPVAAPDGAVISTKAAAGQTAAAPAAKTANPQKKK